MQSICAVGGAAASAAGGFSGVGRDSHNAERASDSMMFVFGLFRLVWRTS